MKNNTAIVLLLLSIGLFYTFTNSQYREAKELSALANEYQSVLKNISQIVELRDSLLATYATIPVVEIDRMNKVLPDNIDTVRLALDLDSMAARYGISIKNIQTILGTNRNANLIVLPEYESAYETATFMFGFVSSYDNFMRFLADIEKNLRIMDIKSITFQTSDSGFYDYQVSAETYWLNK